MQLATLHAANCPRKFPIFLFKYLVCLGAAAVLIERLWIMSNLPLWLDETWSGMIATQSHWPTFWREVWLDCNPPLYYLLLKVWVFLFGDTNVALRLPSLLFTTGAAFVALKWGIKWLSDAGAWTWAALIFFWFHGLTTSVDARGYGLLLLLSTAACLVFAHLYDRLALRGTALWVFISGLLFLTHYYAATLIAAQAFILLYRHRLQLFKVWPAGLAGLPALAWFIFHVPRLQEYARPDVAWYHPVDLISAIAYTQYVFGHPSSAFLPLVLLTVLVGLAFNIGMEDSQSQELSEPPSNKAAIRATAVSGLVGLALALAIGAMRASLTARYLVPLVPPILLGIVLVADLSKRRFLIYTLLVFIYFYSSINFFQLKNYSENRNEYGYEKGSDFISKYNPQLLIFTWDHPAAKILDQRSMEKIGNYFLHRQGLDTKTVALTLREREDPNVALRDAAVGERAAIIWLYNTRRKSAARNYPSTFGNDPSWSCQHFHQPDREGELGAIACVKKEIDNV